MKAGDLRHRIQLLNPGTVTKNAAGQKVSGAMVSVATVWAAKWQLSVRDTNRQAGLNQQAEAKFLIRYRNDITTKTQVQFKGVNYQVTQTEDYEDGQGMFLFVRSIDD